MEYGDGRGNAGAEIKQNLIGRDVYQDHKPEPPKISSPFSVKINYLWSSFICVLDTLRPCWYGHLT